MKVFEGIECKVLVSEIREKSSTNSHELCKPCYESVKFDDLGWILQLRGGKSSTLIIAMRSLPILGL